MSDSWSPLLSLCSTLLANGAEPSIVVGAIHQTWRRSDWPACAADWNRMLSDLANATSNWEVVLGTASRFVRRDTPLTWHMVFAALQPLLASDEARFALMGKLLKSHRDRKPRGFIHVPMANLHAAGIHPVSLLLSSYPIIGTARVAALIRMMRSITCAAVPIGYGDSSWKNDIVQWDWDLTSGGVLDGVVSSNPLSVWADPRSTCSVGRTRLGDRILIGDRLLVEGLTDLQTLGSELHVYGDLELRHLPKLQYLGNEIRVHANLIIRSCPELTMLPASLHVGGQIRVDKGSALIPHIPPDKLCTATFPKPFKVELPAELEALVNP